MPLKVIQWLENTFGLNIFKIFKMKEKKNEKLRKK